MIGGLLAPHVPWQVFLNVSDDALGQGYAGGTLISDRWVLTAGTNLYVRMNRTEMKRNDPLIPKLYVGIVGLPEANASSEVEVEKIVLHPNFLNHSNWDNNLALIKLKEPVLMSDKVAPIPLPERGQDLTNITDGIISGWGWGALLTPATSLKYLILPIANHSSCKAYYKKKPFTPDVDDNMFCTSISRFGENVCFGDAGGALAVRDPDSGDVFVAGILIYDRNCRVRQYGIFLKMSSYLPWIHSVIRGDEENSPAVRAAAVSTMYSNV
ncbi:haptoglobin isoform X2 [Cynoglossus semilaevis]|nr:haptoglobin-like isoform X2 [Cynoglossus semilaevis]